jgi:iron complex outermembrane receptor protein
LSSGAGTPKIRGNWQNTLQVGRYSLTATTFYTSHIKQVAADEGATPELSCAADNLYGTGDNFCYAKRFIYVNLNGTVQVNDKFSMYGTITNVTGAKAPVVPESYSGVNYLPTWHMAGVIGRTFMVGGNFKF